MNTYSNIWAVKVAGNSVKPGDVVPVTTKHGKVKSETVLCVISQSTEDGQLFTLCAVQPKPAKPVAA